MNTQAANLDISMIIGEIESPKTVNTDKTTDTGTTCLNWYTLTCNC